MANLARRVWRRIASLPGGLHRDQSGSISLASVFALLLLVFLLGMVLNSSRQVDHRVRMQNAADAATYSGSVVIARNMNTLAFTNHLLSDVFALTAFMREARDRKAESLTPEILANWQRLGPAFQGSPFPKFDQLGTAIEEKVPIEAEMIRTYGDWAQAASEQMLPVLETILAERMIPEFQRSLTLATPQMAQLASDEIARRHGRSWPQPVELRGVLWRTLGDPVGGVSEDARRTLPVVDPVMDNDLLQATHFSNARRQRRSAASRYLAAWNAESLAVFDRYGKMSQYSNLWRIFTRGNLKRLLEQEYPADNLPFQIRTPFPNIRNLNDHLEQEFMFVGVVYRKKIKDLIPGIFKNPVVADTHAYAQSMVYVPRRRLELRYRSRSSVAGVPYRVRMPGDSRDILPPDNPTVRPPGGGAREAYVTRQWRPRYRDIDPRWDRTAGTHLVRWDLMNQNWSMQMTPATARGIPAILSTQPYVNGVARVATPDLSRLNLDDMQWLSHH